MRMQTLPGHSAIFYAPPCARAIPTTAQCFDPPQRITQELLNNRRAAQQTFFVTGEQS